MAIVPRKRKDGSTAYGVTVRVKVDGERKPQWIGTYDRKKDAIAAETEAKREIRMRGVYERPEQVSLGRVMEDYVASRPLAPSTRTLFRTTRTRLREYFGLDTPISTITKLQAEKYATWLGSNYAETTTSREIKRVRAVMNSAVTWGYIDRNPFEGVRGGGKPPRHSGALAPNEIALFLTEMVRVSTSERYALAAHALVVSGLRLSEARGLRKENLNLKDGLILVREQVTGKEGAFVASTLKTKSSKRDVELSPEGAAVFESMAAGSPSDYVFDMGGGQYVSNVFQLRVREAFDNIGLPWASAHTLRHTYGSLLIEGGAPLTYVQRQMGHSRLSTTLDVYAHLIEDTGHASVLDEVLGSNG